MVLNYKEKIAINSDDKLRWNKMASPNIKKSFARIQSGLSKTDQKNLKLCQQK